MRKSPWEPRSEFFECPCQSLEHTIVFHVYDWGKDAEGGKASPKELEKWHPADLVELEVSMHLPTWPGLWKRLWLALKYVFGFGWKYGQMDLSTITYEDSFRLTELLKDYQSKVLEYKKEFKKG